MGGGCVIRTFGVLQMAASRARARKKKFPQKKSRDFWNGGRYARLARYAATPPEAPKVQGATYARTQLVESFPSGLVSIASGVRILNLGKVGLQFILHRKKGWRNQDQRVTR